MKCKFKVGDLVIGNKLNHYSITKEGWVGKVTEVVPNRYIVVNTPNMLYSYGFKVKEDWFDLYTPHATNEKIVITVEGNTTLARLYKDGKVVKSAEARCCPEDTFDFATGANLAYNRLMGVPTGEETKEATKPVSKFKPGDKVVVRKNTCAHSYKTGDVLILKKIWYGLGIEKRVMWIFTDGDTIDDPAGFGYIVEDDIELYDTLKLTKEDIKKMKDGKKVWCSVINHPVFGKEEEEFNDAEYCIWHTIRHLSPTSTVLVGDNGDYWDIFDLGIEFNAYLTEQKR